MKRRALIASLLSAALTVSAIASAALVSAGDEDVTFLAEGTAGMKINGKASSLSAREHNGVLRITVPVGDLKTGIGLRDRHLRGYLKTDKNPNATLQIDRAKLKLPADGKELRSSATGQFTIAGVTKPLKFTYKAKRTGSDYHVQALATVDIRDHDIEQPCWLRVCVEPDVKLKVKFKLRDK
ncbi:MAG: YceI family protein [Polyangiaceae bacterium]|nr:YceI family protein [Polyangiaceae bacterium]